MQNKVISSKIYQTRYLPSLVCLLGVIITTGCYVPLRSPSVPATHLSCSFRTPERGVANKINLASLTVPGPPDYILGPNDTIEVIIPGLTERQEITPIQTRIMADGSARLPLVGPVKVSGMNLSDAQKAINDAYADGIIVSPRVSIRLAEPATFDIVVTGEVTSPGVYSLPRFQNDIAHAIALAGRMTPEAASVIKVHRRMSEEELMRRLPSTLPEGEQLHDFVLPEMLPAFTSHLDTSSGGEVEVVLQIPVRGGPPAIIVQNQVLIQPFLSKQDVSLKPGDVVVVPRQPAQVFFVVGPLDRRRSVNFTISTQDRQLGNAFLLPDDRDIDAVTAVAMAGYIDPIDSPSTVTVQRARPGAPPLLIRVDLIAARYDWNENVYIKHGDIIYLELAGLVGDRSAGEFWAGESWARSGWTLRLRAVMQWGRLSSAA